MDLHDDYEQATARGDRLRQGPTVVAASYDEARGEIVVRLSTGLSLLIDPPQVQGLSGATSQALSVIEITPSGLGLHWPLLDADVHVPALIEGFTGSKAWMAAQLGRKGGQSTSPSKGAAARENGRLGGRPRKAVPRYAFEIYKDKAGEFRVRFRLNSEVMFTTEGYKSKASALNAIESMRLNGPAAPIEDKTRPEQRALT